MSLPGVQEGPYFEPIIAVCAWSIVNVDQGQVDAL
jgi:hypothetical protein